MFGAAVRSAFTASNVGLFRAEALVETGRHAEATAVLLDTCGGPELPLLERPWRGRARQVLVRAAIGRGDHPTAGKWLARGRVEVVDVPSPRGSCTSTTRRRPCGRPGAIRPVPWARPARRSPPPKPPEHPSRRPAPPS